MALKDGAVYGPSAADGPRQFWYAPVPPPSRDGGVSPVPPLVVELNHGRWIVCCPDCNGAQFAHPTDHRFMCNECGNVAVGNLWRAIEWPNNRAAIEAVLESRPLSNQNWAPGQTVDDLQTENLLRGGGH